MNKQEIQLQAPGAGLPFFQQLFLKYYMGPFVSKKDSWEALEKRFEQVYGKVVRECEGLSDFQMNTRVLVQPIAGIEDSSRYWSIGMTLEHMLMVGDGIKKMIIELSHRRTFPIHVDIAQLKPREKMTAKEAFAEMKHFHQQTLPELKASIGNPKSKTTHFHPWFGPFTAHQWFWLLSGYGFIHLTQIRAIKEGLQIS